jgi:hypothetical protein
VPFAAAAAIAAYITLYLLSSQSSWGGGTSSSLQGQLLGLQWGQQLAVPPMGLVSPDKLTALLRLFKYRFGGSGPPMYELLEGVPCRWACILGILCRVGLCVVQQTTPVGWLMDVLCKCAALVHKLLCRVGG